MGLNRKNDFDLDFGPLKGIKSSGEEVSYINNENYNSLIDKLTKNASTSYLLDVMSIFGAITSSFSSDAWTASYIVEQPGEYVVNGQFEAEGNFTDEPSTFNVMGITDNFDTGLNQILIANYSVRFTEGTLLGAFEQSTSLRLGAFENIEYTYKYEYDAGAAGIDPQHIHDFRIIVDSTNILGYVVIGADGSDSHSFIIDSAGG